jgi:AmmeMemoRadiSam system protein B
LISLRIEEYTAISVADADCRHVDSGEMFYPKTTEELKFLLDALFISTVTSVTNLCGVTTPSAVYIYSGKCAVHSCTKIHRTFIDTIGTFAMINQSHADCMTETTDLIWKTPLNLIPPKKQPNVTWNAACAPKHHDPMQVQKNPLEVQVLCIQYWFSQAKTAQVLPVDQSLTTTKITTNTLSQAIDGTNADIVIFASGNESHCATAIVAKQDELTVIIPATKYTTKLYVHACCEYPLEINRSMCDHNCISVTMFTCKQLDSSETKTNMYRVSGDIINDCHKIVDHVVMGVT